MKVLSINIKGDYARFTNPFTNNDPFTFNVITKPALLGIMAAINGYNREICKSTDFYKKMSEHVKYSVKLNNPFSKYYWKEYILNICENTYSPSNSEKLYDIDYDVFLLYNEKESYVNDIIKEFINNLKNNVYHYTPYLGMANMFCDVKFIYDNSVDTESDGVFSSEGFISDLILDENTPYNDIIVDNVPIVCGFLAHEKHKEIYFHSKGNTLQGKGHYYVINGKNYEFV